MTNPSRTTCGTCIELRARIVELEEQFRVQALATGEEMSRRQGMEKNWDTMAASIKTHHEAAERAQAESFRAKRLLLNLAPSVAVQSRNKSIAPENRAELAALEPELLAVLQGFSAHEYLQELKVRVVDVTLRRTKHQGLISSDRELEYLRERVLDLVKDLT